MQLKDVSVQLTEIIAIADIVIVVDRKFKILPALTPIANVLEHLLSI